MLQNTNRLIEKVCLSCCPTPCTVYNPLLSGHHITQLVKSSFTKFYIIYYALNAQKAGEEALIVTPGKMSVINCNTYIGNDQPSHDDQYSI